MTTLENLYYGNIAPHEYVVVRGSEYDITDRCFDLLDIVLLTARVFIGGDSLTVAVGLWELIDQI